MIFAYRDNWSPAPDLIPKHVLYIPNSFDCYYCIWLWIQNQLFNLQYCGVLIQIISISMNLLKDHNGWQEVVIEAGFHVVVWMGKNWYTWLRSKFMVNCLDEQNFQQFVNHHMTETSLICYCHQVAQTKMIGHSLLI